jgi:hypothetical protein
MTTLAPVIPLTPEATRIRKPNRRSGSVPQPRRWTGSQLRAILIGELSLRGLPSPGESWAAADLQELAQSWP